MGTKDSLDLHSKLYYVDDTTSDINIFTTSIVMDFIDYKMSQATIPFLLYSGPYLLYMILLNVLPT